MEKKRLDELKKLIRNRKCSHILVTDTVDVCYVSGFRSSNATLLISSKDNFLFTDFRYKEAAGGFCAKNPEWQFVLIKESNFEYITPYVKSGSVIGYQSNVITVDQLGKLKSAAKRARLLPLSEEISSVSISKTKSEIAAMKTAANIGDSAFSRLLTYIKAGITELELAHTLEGLCSELGSEKPSFDTIVLFGARSALPHGQPGKKPLRSGDWVLIDFGCTFKSFCSDMTRTVVAGRANSRQREIYEIVRHAQEKARKAARAGMKSSKLDAIARTEITRAGFGEEFGHSLGHGVGIRIHENPRVSSNINAKLQVGAVVTIEPGIYISNFGGVRIEDMVALTETGSQLLTRSPRNLTEIPL